ncbi:glutamate receptor U1-like [Periplaneta americana]|uniref:glutamate receptor U1-like n=1 Tax=Periplaneta americana TaxID=6978 RepID=UPI0037E85624
MLMERLILLSTFLAYSHPFLSNYVQTVTTVTHYFQSGCVYLIHHHKNSLQERTVLLEATKHFSRRRISVAIFSTSMNKEYLNKIKCRKNRPLYVIYFKEQNVAQFLQELSSDVALSSAKWLLILDTNSSLDELFSKVNIPFDCEFLVAHPEGVKVVLTKLYRVGPTLPLQKFQIGEWSSRGDIKWSTSGLERRNKLQGLILKTGVLDASLTKITKTSNHKPIEVGGFFGDIWNILQQTLLFQSDFYKSVDNTYGTGTRNDSNGVVDMVVRNEVHVTPVDLYWTTERASVLDFITPIRRVRSYLMFRMTESSDSNWMGLLTPFSTDLWLVFLVFMIIFSIFLKCTTKVWSKYRGMERNMSTLNSFKSSLCVFRAFVAQACPDVPTSWPSRMVYLTVYLCGVVVLTSYSASLISHITTHVYKLPFANFQEFLSDGTYRLGVLPFSGTAMYFMNSTNTMLQEVYKNHIAPLGLDRPKSEYEILQNVCVRPKYATVLSTLKFQSLKNKLNCTILSVPDAFFEATMTMGIQKGSPYLEILKHTTNNMLRSGILRNIEKRNIPQGLTKLKTTFTSVTVPDITPVLVVLLIGIAASLLLLIFELISGYKTRLKKIPNERFARTKLTGIRIGRYRARRNHSYVL